MLFFKYLDNVSLPILKCFEQTTVGYIPIRFRVSASYTYTNFCSLLRVSKDLVTLNIGFKGPLLSRVCIVINSGEKVLSYIGLRTPLWLSLNSKVCLNPLVFPAIGAKFNFPPF